ncbi:putative short-chain dehydrogenase [Xylaria arbuscula]|nr:putative short-chain dehydrogenase [Xylaria arbuscula]
MAADTTTTTMGKTILITGANGGLGSAIVEQITSNPGYAINHGLYTVRDPTNSPAIASALCHDSTHACDTLKLDLNKLDNVREVAHEINTRVAKGEIPLIGQSWTQSGLDTAFAFNYLGHWLLSLLLLRASTRNQGASSHDPRSAIIGAFQDPKYQTIVSDAAGFGHIARGTCLDRSFRGGFRRYGAAKLFLIMMQHELQARMSADPALGKVSIVGVGLSRMVGYRHDAARAAAHPRALNPDHLPGHLPRRAREVLEAAFMEYQVPMGAYLDEGALRITSEESRDLEKRKLVWRETVKLAGLKRGDTVFADWQ